MSPGNTCTFTCWFFIFSYHYHKKTLLGLPVFLLWLFSFFTITHASNYENSKEKANIIITNTKYKIADVLDDIALPPDYPSIAIPTTVYQAIVPYLWHDIAWGIPGLVEFLLF